MHVGFIGKKEAHRKLVGDQGVSSMSRFVYGSYVSLIPTLEQSITGAASKEEGL